MKKPNSLKPFLPQKDSDEFEFNKNNYYKNSTLNNNKIYFFRTSLFTEKSKNFIQRMNSCHKKVSNNKEFNGIIKPKIKKDDLFHKKNEKSDKIVILEDKNKIKKIDEKKKDSNQTNKTNNNKKIIKIKERNDDNNNNTNNKSIINDITEKKHKIKIQTISKSNNNLINIYAKTKNNNYQIKFNNKSKTEDKKENKLYNENLQKINSIVINNIKKCKLFASLPNAIEKINLNISKINNRNILGNYTFKSQSTDNTHLPNQILEQNHLRQKKIIKMLEFDDKIKYKLKSIKCQNKENDINKNTNIVPNKSIYDNNTMKNGIKYYKSISKHCNFQSFSI